MILEKLQKVQNEIKAPKNLYNSFGKYKYRNVEGILESFKPYGKKYGLALTISDEIVQIGERIYVKAIIGCLVIDIHGIFHQLLTLVVLLVLGMSAI